MDQAKAEEIVHKDKEDSGALTVMGERRRRRRRRRERMPRGPVLQEGFDGSRRST